MERKGSFGRALTAFSRAVTLRLSRVKYRMRRELQPRAFLFLAGLVTSVNSSIFDFSVCNICKDFLEEGDMVDLEDLLQSAGIGCHTCAIVREGLGRCMPEIVGEKGWEIQIGDGVSYGKQDPPSLSVKLQRAGKFDEGLGRELEFFCLKNNPSPWPILGFALNTPEDTASPSSFHHVVEWIQQCLNSHRLCNLNPAPQLPTRVLKLSNSNGDQRVQLYESQNEHERYTCLSHCWGNSESLTTTTASIERWKGDIPWSVLPKTFQDSIIFTQQLEIRFLWIDSLCIIQDNEEDWKKESAKMAAIYQGAFLTLAASKSANSNGGCFAQTPPDQQAHLLSNYDPKTRKPYSIYVRPTIPHWYILESDHDHFPLLSRGWVYQERLLSNRMLHFGSRELIWECMEATECECSGAALIKPERHPKIQHKEAFTHEKPSESLAAHWRHMIYEYTRLNLSRPSDTLPALSGLVKQMQDYREGRYLTGLWEDSLIEDLCWFCGGSSIRSPKWRAPTWSWASIDATHIIAPLRRRVQKHARILEVECNPTSSELVDSPVPGYVTIQGRVTAVVVVDENIGLSGHRQNFDIKFENRDKPTLYSFYPDFDFQAAGESHIGIGTTLYCLKMTTDLDRNLLYMLVLQCFSEIDELYERVGLLQVYQDHEVDVNWYDEISKEAVVRIR